MKRTAVVLAAALAVVPTCNAKPFYKSRRWWVGEAVIVGAYVADARSTIVGRRNCPGCAEGSLALSAHPSNNGIIGVALLGIGLESTFHALAHWSLQRDAPAWQFAGDTAIPAENAAIILPGVVHNYRLQSGTAK